MSRQAYAEVVTYVDPDSGDLRPADQVEVFVYEAGTTTKVSIYESRTGSTLVSNPFIAGTNGLVSFWAIDGDYDIKFHDTKVPARFGDYTLGWQSSPVDVEISEGELSNAGDIEWERDPKTGAWIPQIKEGSVGTKEIAENGVGSSEIAANAVGEPEIADGATTSRKFKPTCGILYGTGSPVTLKAAYEDVPGTELKITPLVPSKIKVWCIWAFTVNGQGGVGANAEGTLYLDGTDQSHNQEFGEGGSTQIWVEASVAQNYVLSLTAVEHKLKLRAKSTVQTGTSALVTAVSCSLMYELVAS